MAKYANGFSLIEILIVLSIVGMIVLFSVSAFSEYARLLDFESKSVDLAAMVDETRKKTISAETDQNFGIRFSTTTVVVYEGDYILGAPTNKTYTFTGLVIEPSLSGATTTVSFARLTGVPSATGTILLRHDRSSSTYSFKILEGGVFW